MAMGADGPATVRLCPNTTFEGTFTIDRNVTVIGAGTESTILDGRSGGAVVTVTGNVTASELRSLRLTNGNRTEINGGEQAGGGLWNEGTIVLRACDVVNNRAKLGGGIASVGGHLTLIDTTVRQNLPDGGAADSVGGGIYSSHSTLKLQGSTRVEANIAPLGGGLYTSGAGAQVDLRDDTIVTQNQATFGDGGGGIFNDGASVQFFDRSKVTANTPNNCVGTTTCPS